MICSLFQEKEMEKQRLLYQQSRLHNRGAAEMVLQMISACKGMVHHKASKARSAPTLSYPSSV